MLVKTIKQYSWFHGKVCLAFAKRLQDPGHSKCDVISALWETESGRTWVGAGLSQNKAKQGLGCGPAKPGFSAQESSGAFHRSKKRIYSRLTKEQRTQDLGFVWFQALVVESGVLQMLGKRFITELHPKLHCLLSLKAKCKFESFCLTFHFEIIFKFYSYLAIISGSVWFT